MSVSREIGWRWPIIGHDHIGRYLQQILTLDQLSHAYLFVGPTGIGKATVARYLVNTLVCLNRDKAVMPVPCGQCQACIQIKHNHHPDVVWLERVVDEKTGTLKKNISIDQVRQLSSRLGLKSFFDSSNIGVIDGAEQLSTEAANALLKTLEEPPGKTVLIILTSRLSALPATIVSRCQVVHFTPVSINTIEKYLRLQGVEPKKARTLAALSFGRPGLALRYSLDPDGLTEFQECYREFLMLLRADVSTRLTILSKLAIRLTGEQISSTFRIYRQVIHDILLVRSNLSSLVSNQTQLAAVRELAAQQSVAQLVNLAFNIDVAERYIGANVNARYAVENLLLSY